MKLPPEVAVMTLPNVTLFPQALLPLFIFEPRYRRMLADALASHRMFAVAMNRSATGRETPVPVAGLVVIRVAGQHNDGTSHLVLQGVARVELGKATRYKPYRVHRVHALETSPGNAVTEDALLEKVRELVRARFKLGLPFPFPFMSELQVGQPAELPPANTAKDVLSYLDSISDPEQAADMVSYAVLASPRDRQTILEATDVQTRLRCLIKFLLRDLRRSQKAKGK